MITVHNIIETWLNEPDISKHFEMRQGWTRQCSFSTAKPALEIYCNCTDFNYKNLDRWNTIPLDIKVADIIGEEICIVDENMPDRLGRSLIKIDIKHPFSFNRLRAYFYSRHNKIKACDKYLCQR